MKYVILLLAVLSLSGCVGDTSRLQHLDTDKSVIPNNAESMDTVDNLSLADPFIMLHEGTYYAYGIGAANGIAVFESKDLTTWRRAVGRAAEELALHKDDVYGMKGFWSPEVYCIDRVFYMYYSADEHICVATSDSPLGPFAQAEQKPMITGEKNINNTLFIDADQKKYMYFNRFDGGSNKTVNFDRFNSELDIWVCELKDNLLEIKSGTMRKCIGVSQEWEKTWPRVNEGCDVIMQNGRYYMIYSANSGESQNCGIGCATAASPFGPWTKYDDNPILHSPGELVGVGHGSMFNDKAGKLRIVFHTHNSREKIYPRKMFISDVNFRYRNGNYIMEIKDEFIAPRTEG